MIDARRLRVLCEVARNGSFSGAAESLGYTQPAVSRQVATLEAEVGTPLVRRVPQGALLTDAGRLMVERGERILASLNDLELELQALTGLEGGTLRLASFASAAASIVPLAIAAFRRRHPAVELEVVMADPIDSVAKLRAGELDIALSNDGFDRLGPGVAAAPATARPASADGPVTASDPITAARAVTSADPATAAGAATPGVPVITGTPPPSAAGLELVHLFDDPMYVAMPYTHPLVDAPRLSLTSFASEQWMLATTRSCPDSRLLLRACHAAGFEPNIAMQSDDYSAILGFVAAGVGVALVPDMVLRSVRDDVVVRAVDPPAPSRPIVAVLPAGYRSPAADAMLAVLREVSEEWVANRCLLVPGEPVRAASGR